jgi:hypothetical protein
VLRRIFGWKREEVVRGRRKLHNEKLFNLYASLNIISVIKSRKMTWNDYEARMGKFRKEYKILTGKSEGKRPLGGPRRRWKDNIRMYLGDRV